MSQPHSILKKVSRYCGMKRNESNRARSGARFDVSISKLPEPEDIAARMH
jgi:hypothetical protein